MLAILVGGAGTTVAGQELSVEEIVAKTNEMAYYQGKDGRAQVAMTIADAQGREQSRQFTILRRNTGASGGPQSYYVYFTRPADVNKTAFLVWKKPGGEDDRWLFLPALDLVKRIAASDKRTSFMGSSFFYEDVSGRDLAADTHELEKTTDTYYVLKNTPKDAHSVEFAFFRMWVHKSSFLPVKAEYYDSGGEAYRQYEALKVEGVQGYQTVTQARMKDLRTGVSTLLRYAKVAYDIGLGEDVFTERYLRNPPAELLR
ncbi:MAG: outer membrane lipoprotein-sorting protein [Candidatus Schekmanbacteria bacterium]|nr:outer membrane lipoprotein-sorting protein [Candidatus Schekmanbacteria bacterium]